MQCFFSVCPPWVYCRYSSPSALFKATFGSITITWGLVGTTGDCAQITAGGCTSGAHQINIFSWGSTDERKINLVVHEIGHAFSSLWSANAQFFNDPQATNPSVLLAWTQGLPSSPFYNPAYPNRSDFPDPLESRWWQGPTFGFASPQNVTTWQMSVHNAGSAGEEFADQFLGWTFGMWEDSVEGNMRSLWMQSYMPGWINFQSSP
jgi:hypothetical protein